MKYLGTVLRSGHDVGVVHEILVCPAGHWEGLYGNVNPWGFGEWFCFLDLIISTLSASICHMNEWRD